VALGSELPSLSGYPFEVRYSEGTLDRAKASADAASEAYGYFSSLFSGVAPDISVVVADEQDWPDDGPSFGMPYFSDERGERAGVLVMPARAGEFWNEMAQELRDAPLRGYANLLEVYPDGAGGLDLQPFIDLITLHELGHAFEVLGNLQLPTSWLGEIFANLALHTYVATQRPESLLTLETFSTVGAASGPLDARIRSGGYSTLEQFEAHYPGSDEPISWVNYVWFQYRWQRLAAAMFDTDGETALIRFWECFQSMNGRTTQPASAMSLAPMLTRDVSETLGRTIQEWH
jgi:hypothetical protein